MNEMIELVRKSVKEVNECVVCMEFIATRVENVFRNALMKLKEIVAVLVDIECECV